MRNIVAGLFLIAAGQGAIRSGGKSKVQLLTANSARNALAGKLTGKMGIIAPTVGR